LSRLLEVVDRALLVAATASVAAAVVTDGMVGVLLTLAGDEDVVVAVLLALVDPLAAPVPVAVVVVEALPDELGLVPLEARAAPDGVDDSANNALDELDLEADEGRGDAEEKAKGALLVGLVLLTLDERVRLLAADGDRSRVLGLAPTEVVLVVVVAGPPDVTGGALADLGAGGPSTAVTTEEEAKDEAEGALLLLGLLKGRSSSGEEGEGGGGDGELHCDELVWLVLGCGEASVESEEA